VKPLRLLGIAGLALGVFAYPAVLLLDRSCGTEVIMIAPRDEGDVALERFNWTNEGARKEPHLVAEIYGKPFDKGETKRLLSPDAAKILHPKEDPTVTLFLKGDQDNPLQVQTLWYFAPFLAAGGLGAGGLLFWLSCRKKA
jgi:hypothetical protein